DSSCARNGSGSRSPAGGGVRSVRNTGRSGSSVASGVASPAHAASTASRCWSMPHSSMKRGAFASRAPQRVQRDSASGAPGSDWASWHASHHASKPCAPGPSQAVASHASQASRQRGPLLDATQALLAGAALVVDLLLLADAEVEEVLGL